MNDKMMTAMEKLKTAKTLQDEALNDLARELNGLLCALDIRDENDEDYAIVKFYADDGKLFFETECVD